MVRAGNGMSSPAVLILDYVAKTVSSVKPSYWCSTLHVYGLFAKDNSNQPNHGSYCSYGYGLTIVAMTKEVILDGWGLVGTYYILFVRMWGVLFDYG